MCYIYFKENHLGHIYLKLLHSQVNHDMVKLYKTYSLTIPLALVVHHVGSSLGSNRGLGKFLVEVSTFDLKTFE